MKKIFLITLLLLFSMILFSTTRVSVSIPPQKTFVEAVGKELVDVHVIIPPGNSPANYAPTARQMIDFSRSSVYFTIGVPAEASNILPKMVKNAPDVVVIKLEEKVDYVYDPRYFSKDNRDPHIWLSPKRVIVMIETIRDYLSSIDSSNREYYIKNAQEYIGKLNQLDNEMRDSLTKIEDRGFFCFHPSFGYFADDYSLEMYALEEHGKEATPQKLTQMIELAKKNDFKVIFYQAEIDSSQTRSFADEIDGKALKLDPLSKDYIENLKTMSQIFLEVLGNKDE